MGVSGYRYFGLLIHLHISFYSSFLATYFGYCYLICAWIIVVFWSYIAYMLFVVWFPLLLMWFCSKNMHNSGFTLVIWSYFCFLVSVIISFFGFPTSCIKPIEKTWYGALGHFFISFLHSCSWFGHRLGILSLFLHTRQHLIRTLYTNIWWLNSARMTMHF